MVVVVTPLTDPLSTVSPASLVTGILSPVRDDSSKAALADTRRPSTGTTSPDFTMIVSPMRTSAAAMSSI